MPSTPNMHAFLTVLLRPFQELEDAFRQLETGMQLDNAVGVQLDMVGGKVGQARVAGQDDATYKRYIRARILANRSNGTVDDIIAIIRVLVDDPTQEVHVVDAATGGGTIVVRMRLQPMTDDARDQLVTFVSAAVAGGVRLVVESSTAAAGATFRWDTPGAGWDSGKPFVDAKDTA